MVYQGIVTDEFLILHAYTEKCIALENHYRTVECLPVPGSGVVEHVVDENARLCNVRCSNLSYVDKTLKLLVGSDVADLVSYIIGYVLEHQGNHIQLIYSLFHGFGHQRASLGFLNGIGDGVVLQVICVVDRLYVRIISTEGNLVGCRPEITVEQSAVAATITLDLSVIEHKLTAFIVDSHKAERDSGVHGGHFVFGFNHGFGHHACAGAIDDLALTRDHNVEIHLLLIAIVAAIEGRDIVDLCAG